MIKRIALFLLLAGLMAGCQSSVEPTEEVDKETEPVEKVAAEATETKEKVADQEIKEDKVDEVKAAEEKTEAQAEKAAPVVTAVVASVPVKQKPTVEKGNTIMILMKTSKGDIKIELDADKAPKTVANFMKYVESGHYTDVIFHRVIGNFMVQGGGFDENMNQKPAPHTVENEAKNGLKNDEGTIAMARTNDPHSGGAQFFINVGNNSFLNYPGQDGWGYCVFGKVVDGMDVVNEIKSVPTGNKGPHGDVPKDPIFIKEVVVVED